MKQLEWSEEALNDLARLHDFLAAVNEAAAAEAVRTLAQAPGRLLEYPRLGERLEQFQPHDVRRILIGRYEMRYEIRGERIIILRLWHSRENR